MPRQRVRRAQQSVDEADALLVVGSSLVVYSGFRFVKQAHKRGIPIAILNLGPTRGDDLASLKIDASAGAALTAMTDRLA